MKHADMKHKLMIVRAEQQRLESLSRTISLSLSLSKALLIEVLPLFPSCIPPPFLLSEAQLLAVDLKQGLRFIKSVVGACDGYRESLGSSDG